MPSWLPDFAFYRDAWRGELDEESFGRAMPHAEAAVREIVHPRDPSDAPEQHRRAVCAACDVDAAHGFSGGSGEGGSIRLGSFSASGAGADGGYSADMLAAVRAQLAGTRLLYRGLS